MRRWFAIVLSLAGLLSAGCTSSQNWRQQISYTGPVQVGIDQGQTLAGTDIKYLGETSNGAQVSIGGQQATKRLGDSLDWNGQLRSGVTMDESLRVVSIGQQTLHAAGTVTFDIATPQPQTEAPDESAPVHYTLPVAYNVAKGAAIPGTVITYVGNTSQGAQLGGVEGYAYRHEGDSIAWAGKLRDGVWVSLSLRTALVRDSSLSVVGTADVWVMPG